MALLEASTRNHFKSIDFFCGKHEGAAPLFDLEKPYINERYSCEDLDYLMNMTYGVEGWAEENIEVDPEFEEDFDYDSMLEEIQEEARERYLPLREKAALRSGIFDSFRRLDILQELVDDPEVTEIMVNGKDHIFIEKHGHMEAWDRSFESEEQLEDMVQQIVSRVNRIVNMANPIADARLEDGSRVHVVLPPVAMDGATVTIRKFPEPITMK